MDSWTLQGDNYSFLRSAPRNFSLCHRDGTPNHVEIFDIINTPSQRSAISETTCLCDIFGDDIEAASLSSSTASAAVIPQQTEVEGRAVVSPSADDLNDSSGSYHTAHSSSEEEEGLEDPNEQQNYFESQKVTQEPDLIGSNNITHCCITPDIKTVSDGEVFDGKNPGILSQSESLTSSLTDIRCSPSPSNLERVLSKTGSRNTTPASVDRHSSLSHHTPSPEPGNCVSSSPSPSLRTQPDFRETSPEPGSICEQIKTSSPELHPNLLQASTFVPKVILPTDVLSLSRAELRGRISVPDLFTRDSTPDLDDHVQTSDPILNVLSDPEDRNISAFKDTDLPLEATDRRSTPDLHFTSPSPLTPLVQSPELGSEKNSSEIRFNSPSSFQNRLSPSSPDRTNDTTPNSPTNPIFSITTDSRNSFHSPLVSHSLSPSPGDSPIVCIDKAASPKIRITASSPEAENICERSFLEHHSNLSTEPPASPQITGISYSIVQPEVQLVPDFSSELLSERLSELPKIGDCCPIRNSPHSILSSEQQQPKDRPKTLSLNSGHKSPLFESLSPNLLPQIASKNLSPVLPDIEQPCEALDNNSEPTYKDTSVRIKPLTSNSFEEVKNSVKSASIPYEIPCENSEEVVAQIESASTVAPSQAISFAIEETTETTSLKRESQSSDALGIDLYPEKLETENNYTEGDTSLRNSPTVVNYPFTDPTIPINDKNKNISPIPKGTGHCPIKTVENPQNLPTNYSLSPKSNRTFNLNLTPKPFRRQLCGTVEFENKTHLKETMTSHVRKRRTPSPPLTRFTPVHIIAPEKPYRQWQNRGRSPPQITTPIHGANFKKVVTNTEIPSVDLVNCSQEDWFRKGRQQKIEGGQQPHEKAFDQELWDSGMYKERKREERIPEREEGWLGDASYREEQVELSFNAKNRKGSVSRSTAVTSRDTRPGLPTVHSNSESLLTRQTKQQQTLHRLLSQPDSKSGSLGRRLQPSITQHKGTTSGRVATNRPGRSSSSSMGSELDEADHEVKWLSDVAFSSLSSPEVDYLDMYNSSHHSSTNVSQPSTQESPAGVNTPLLSYADFSGSTQMLDNDELALQQTSAYYSDGFDPSRCYELGNFECVDVAVEKEDTKRVRRGVPKRQIQLKRRDTTESKQDESSDNSSPGVPVMDTICQDTLLREHCIQSSSLDSEPYGESPELDKLSNATKSKLQKSPSFDESCSKTKIATCLIKSILTKKMQSDELAGEEESCGFEETSKSPRPDMQILSSSLQSDSSLLSDAAGEKCEVKIKEGVGDKITPGGKFSQRPSSTNSNRSVTFSIADSEEGAVETKSAEFPSSHKEMSIEAVHDNSQMWKEKEPEYSANNNITNISPVPGASSTGHVTMTNWEKESENIQCHEQVPQDLSSSYKSRSPNNLSLLFTEKKKASISVCLTPEAETTSLVSNEKVEVCAESKAAEEDDDKVKGPIHKVRDVRRLVKNTYNLSFKGTSATPSDETDDIHKKEKILGENSDEVTQEIERSQEVRQMQTKDETTDSLYKKDEQLPFEREQPTYSHPMQIEYKAVCWKEDKSKSVKEESKTISEIKEPITETLSQNLIDTDDSASTDVQSKAKVDGFTEKQHTFSLQRADRPVLGSLPKMPSKEREVSTAIVLIRDNSRTKRSTSPSHELSSIVPATSPGFTSSQVGSGHSVSMLLKEKGYHADIGAVVGETQAAIVSKRAPSKHVNCLEIPLQTTTDSHRERTFSSSSNTSGPIVTSSNIDSPIIPEVNMEEVEKTGSKSDPNDKINHLPPKSSSVDPPIANKQAQQGEVETVKRLESTFPSRSPAVHKLKTQPMEVKSTAKENNKQHTNTNALGKSRPQAIEVKSVAKNSQKPIVPPKPSCKFKPLDIAAMPGESQRVPPTSSKTHNEDRTQTIVVSSPTIYRKIPNDSTSNYTRKVAISSVSSLKPPPSKPPNVSTQSTLQKAQSSIVTDRQQQSGPPPQSLRYTQRHPTLPPAPTTTSGPTISSSALSDAIVHQSQAPAHSGGIQTSQTAVLDSNSQPHMRMPYPHEPITMGSSDEQPAPVSTAQGPGFTRQPYHRSLSNECSQRRDDLHFYASDDPPSYDERESFSPLRLPDLPPRSTHYQPSSRPPPCPCTSGCPSHPGLSHPHNSPHNITPPGPTLSPGQSVHYPGIQPPVRPHHCRSDPQSVTYQSSSPKSSPLGPGPQQGLYQPLHQPSHPSLIHAYSAERPLQASQHMDPRRPPVHRSPQQPPAVLAGAPYSEPGHSHSPGLSHIDSHYLCGPQLGASYGSEYGGDSSSIYSESSYGQTPRRVLMDPETGKYFYIEVPVQPLRKMLFDPETGQYVEVLIPQQAMSHSGIYPSSAPNYAPIHSSNMYAPAPQYMPYAAPPAQSQPPRYPEPSAATSIHPHGPGVSYRNPSGQGPKAESHSHPPMDPNYLESMYYVPTGINASPNTPPDYYHKHPSHLLPNGAKRS